MVGGLTGSLIRFIILVTPVLVLAMTLQPVVSAEDVGDGLSITFEPETLELALEEEGSFDIEITNNNDHKMHVRIFHFVTKSPEGSRTWISPDSLEIGPGDTGVSKVRVRSNFEGRDASSGVSDVLLAFNWSSNPDDKFLSDEGPGDWKWEYNYDIIDQGNTSDMTVFLVISVIIVILVTTSLAMVLLLGRKRKGPAPAGENN